MDGTVPGLSLEVDPLIAEAKRRARRRRVWVVAAAVLAIAAVVATLTNTLRHPGSAAISTNPPRLYRAAALGTLVSLNRRTGVAEFRISCGWHATKSGRATTKLRPGLYRVSLRGGLFNVGSPLGAAQEMSFPTWERWAAAHTGWGASLRLGSERSRPYLSSGPTTDICHGVLG